MKKFTVDDKDINWNSPNKTKKQKELLRARGKILNMRQNYPLDLKIKMAQTRIRAVMNKYGVNNCYVAFSGGKDSTVLSHMITKMGYKPEHVYSNTRLEYPECLKFSKEWCRKKRVKLTFVMPDKMPFEVWKKHGYPMFSKEIADILERIRRKQSVSNKKMKKVKSYLKYKNLNISSKCCYYLKKKPMKDWQKKSGKKVAFMGIRAKESQMRRTVWVRKGCIYETPTQVVCHPMIFFTKDDIEKYAKRYRIKFADIYYKGFERNGCYSCGFGCHLAKEGEHNNFTLLKEYNPSLWENVMKKWGYRNMCKKCDIKIELKDLNK